MKSKPFLLNLLALIAGAFLTLSFAPFNIFPLAVLSPAVLMSLWLHASPKQAFWRGLLYGLGFFSTGVYWIFISVHTFGNTSLLIALLITSALIFVLALFPALNGFFLNRFFPLNNNTKILCAFPAIWVLLEWVRCWIFSGFPWLLIGYSQLNSPLKGYAPIFSVFGVSLAVVLSSAFLLNTILQFKQTKYKNIYINVFALALIWIIGAGLSFMTWTQPIGEPVKVSLVQGNIAQNLKWSADQVQPTLDRYTELTEKHWDSKIIIWPESAIPLPLQNVATFINELDKKAKTKNVTLLTGIPIKALEGDGYYNAVISLGKGVGLYTKRLLVPFGEYIPMRNLLGSLLDFLQVPMSDFIPGVVLSKPIMANGLKIATFICYEIAYPEQVLSRDGDIDLILTVSNDAWFGHSIAQAQHLEIAQMRALEMGRPVLFGSNDGITAIINNKGKILSTAPQYQAYVLTGNVQRMHGITPWQRFALDPLLLILTSFLLIARRRRKYSS